MAAVKAVMDLLTDDDEMPIIEIDEPPAAAGGKPVAHENGGERLMNATVVSEAIARLRAQGARLIVRAIQSITGGSFRDLVPLLRVLRELPADTLGAGDEDPSEDSPPKGLIATAQQELE